MRQKKTLDEAQINLTPLIDVVFVILIMFIVVAPLLEMETVELASSASLDQRNAKAIQEKSPITIYVKDDDTISFNQQNLSPSQLTKVLAACKKKYPQAKPQLFHDKNAKFGTYQAVKNAVEAAGFAEMDVILKPG